MKTIIYIGDFEAPYSTERYIAYSLKELGYNVVMLKDDVLRWTNVDSTIEDIKSYEPILVLFSKKAPLGKPFQVIEKLKIEKINTACWLFDLYFDLPCSRVIKLKEKAPPFNVETLYSTDGGHQKEFSDCGIKHKVLRQGIFKPEAILYNRPKKREIVFVGGDHFDNRGWLLKGLKDIYGGRFEWWGQRHNPVRNLPLNELYAETKIVVGDSQPSDYYWSNRVYETLGRGGFLLHPYVKGMETEFEDKKHLVYFERGNIKDLQEKIDYYLMHEDEREKIRKAGFELVKSKYTYTDRCRELMKNYEN